MAKKTDDDETIDATEGPRSFAVLIQQIGDGDLHDELAATMQELVGRLNAHAKTYQREAKGKIALSLNVTAMGNGSVAITAGDVKTKLPSRPRARDIYYVTPGGNLSRENPRQQKLALREVPATQGKTKDISTDTPLRGV